MGGGESVGRSTKETDTGTETQETDTETETETDTDTETDAETAEVPGIHGYQVLCGHVSECACICLYIPSDVMYTHIHTQTHTHAFKPGGRGDSIHLQYLRRSSMSRTPSS